MGWGWPLLCSPPQVPTGPGWPCKLAQGLASPRAELRCPPTPPHPKGPRLGLSQLLPHGGPQPYHIFSGFLFCLWFFSRDTGSPTVSLDAVYSKWISAVHAQWSIFSRPRDPGVSGFPHTRESYVRWLAVCSIWACCHPKPFLQGYVCCILWEI